MRDVHDASSKDTGYTTVLKQMQVMAEKGLLERSEQFRSHVYDPRIAKGQTQQRLARNLVRRAFDGSAKNLVLGALSSQKVSAAELKEIRRDAGRVREGGAMTTLMQGLIQLSGHPLVHALGWTLLHFCWQGAAVALMLWCVLGLLGGRSSQARYGAACLALGLMVVLPAATFAHIASAEYKARAAILGSGVVLDAGLCCRSASNEPVPPWPMRIGMALDRSRSLGAAGMVRRRDCLRRPAELRTAGRAPAEDRGNRGSAGRIAALVRALTHSPRRRARGRAAALRAGAGANRHRLAASGRAAAGKLPHGLSPEQIEAVLCHELAHVRRHDYLVSVVQSVIETILFYHPAVWWVSKQVRRERECCCDELAVAVGGDVLAYARALSFLEENRASFPEFVLGANGGVLKMRIKRILGSKRDAEGSPVAALVALGMILAVAGSYFAAVSHAQAQAAREIASAAEPSRKRQRVAGGDDRRNRGALLAGVYKSWLNEDVRWIITDSEARAFKLLANDAERDKFIESFWVRRDPPGAPANTYKDEHYARIAYANVHFGDGTRLPGWSTDRGHIYIVYGKPESIDSHPSGVAAYGVSI